MVNQRQDGQSPSDYSRLEKIGDRVSATSGALIGGFAPEDGLVALLVS